MGWFFGLTVGALVIGCTWLFLKGVGIWGRDDWGARGIWIVETCVVEWVSATRPAHLGDSLLFKQQWRNSK